MPTDDPVEDIEYTGPDYMADYECPACCEAAEYGEPPSALERLAGVLEGE
jgi:hypothetical protein